MNIVITKEGKEQKYKIPTKWSQVKLHQWMQIQKLNDEKFTDVERMLSIVNVLTGIDIEDLNSMKLEYLTDLSAMVQKLMAKKPKEELQNIVKIKGVKYGFHPKLQDMSVGEFADIETYLKDGVEKNIDNILTVLYRKVVREEGDKYEIEKYEPCDKRRDLFRENFNVDWVTGASVFFYRLGKELMIDTKTSLLEEMQKLKQEQELQMTS